MEAANFIAELGAQWEARLLAGKVQPSFDSVNLRILDCGI